MCTFVFKQQVFLKLIDVMTMVSSIMTIVNMAESGKKIISGMILILLLVSVYRRKKSN